MIVGAPRETAAGERRVALVPELVARLVKAGVEVAIEPGAGAGAGFSDSAYASQGARLEPDILTRADVLLKVQPPTLAEIEQVKKGAAVIGLLQPYDGAAAIRALAAREVTAFAMELMPRITRAQSMDALSAMSTVAGYKAVVVAAGLLPRFFPLLMTAAGTISPARVFIIGAGVAGLQAIGTARRLGAVVEAYDTRPAVKEQVESLGARFAELALETGNAQDAGGYATAQSEDFYRRQQALMGQRVAAADVVIATALVPGRRAPVLVSEEMVAGMRPGSVIVDLAAERGGNCALTVAGEDVVRHGVTVVGRTDLAASMPFHASQMYARTVASYLLHLLKDGGLRLDLDDELTRSPLVAHRGELMSELVRPVP
jgi:NAD(P) transhydrogenase subunit alpha